MKKPQSRSSLYNSFKKFIKTSIVCIFILYFVFVVVSAFKIGKDDINYAGLEVASNSDSSIYIDNVKIGSVNQKESFIYSKIEPGAKRLRIQKDDDQNIKYEKDIIFEKGTKVSVEWNFGVTNETSSGLIKYFIKKSEDINKIRIISLTPKSTITIDGNVNKDGVINADGEEHSVDISKDGYLSKDISLRLSNSLNDKSADNNQKFDDYDLIVEIALFQIPFD